MTETMYIRFGDIPETGYSWNAATDTAEAGVSVYRAWWACSSDRDVVTIEVATDAAYVGGVETGLFERPVYIVTGNLLRERGGDGELLMAPGCRAEYVGPVEVVNYVIEDGG